MPIPKTYLADFEEGGLYHVYNRTNNKEKLFLADENRVFFLKRYKEVLAPFADTFCWILLPNHFHVLIKIKSEQPVIDYLQSKPITELTITEKKYLELKIDPENSNREEDVNSQIIFSELIERTFKRFFQSYALAFNKHHHRKGNLFYKPFKRIRIETDAQFTMAIIYIHANAVKHGLVKDFNTYTWSSWHTIISNKPTSLLREDVIKWFGNVEVCVKAHRELVEYYYDNDVCIED